MNLYNLRFRMVILIQFLTQPPHERTLTGRDSRVYPNVGAAGCTLKVGAAGCTLKVGAAGCTLTVGAAYKLYTLIPFLTQPPHERTLTGRGSRVYPNVGAAGCTLKVGAAGCTLTSGQLGVP